MPGLVGSEAGSTEGNRYPALHDSAAGAAFSRHQRDGLNRKNLDKANPADGTNNQDRYRSGSHGVLLPGAGSEKRGPWTGGRFRANSVGASAYLKPGRRAVWGRVVVGRCRFE